MGIASKTFNSLKQICVGNNNVKEVFVGSTKVWTRPGISVSLNDSSDIAITGGSRTITVSCTGDWVVSSTPSWLSVNKSGNTLTVTASTNAKNLDSRSADLTFTQIDTESTVSVTIKQLADEHTTITYGVPEITFNNYSNIVASGATAWPSGSWTQTRVQNWESGSTTTLSDATGIIDGYTTYSGSATGATLNATTGAVTWDNNTSTSARSITVTATVLVNGQTASKTATCTQEEGAKIYGDIAVTKFEYPRFTALSCTKTPILEYTQPWTWNGVAGSGGNITSGLSASYAMSDTSETIWWWDSQNTGAITVTDNNTLLEKTITVTVTVSGNLKTATATHTATQNAGTVEYIITPSTTATGELDPIGSTTSTITYTTKWNDKVTATGTALSGYTITENSDTKSCMTATGTSGTVTIAANNQNLEGGTFEYTISKSGYTSATITGSVAKGYYTYSEITDLSCTYSTISAAGGSSSPSISYKQTYGWNGATSGIATITGGTNDDDYTTYSVVSGKDVTLNTTTGIVTWGIYNPTSGSQDTAGRSATIKMIVSRNGKTASTEVTASQAGEVVTKTEYGDWTFSLTPSTTSIGAAGGTVTMILSRPTRSVKYIYSSGDTKTVTETATAGTFALTRSNASFTLSGTSVTMNASTVPTFTISVGATGAAAVAAISTTVTAAFTATDPTTGTTTASVTSGSITRSAASFVQDHYRFSTFTLSKTSFTAASGSATLSMGIQKRSEYTGSQYTSWADHNPGSGLTISVGTGGSVGTITYGAPSTSTISVAANRLDNSTGGAARSISVNATLKVSSSVVATSSALTISQEADKISSYNKPVVTFQDYTNKDASAGTKGLTATPTFTQPINYVSGYTSSTSSGGTIVYSGSAIWATVNTSTGVITWERNESETNSRSITVTATITANGQSGSDTATCTQTKDVVSYTYANPVVYLAYNTNAEPSKSATQSPTISYSQVRTNSYVSGKPSTTTTLTSGASSITYAETTAHANASVNASSGVVTWDSANTSTSSTRSCGITATVTANGKIGTGSATATQRTDYVNSYSYSDVTVSLAYGTDAEPTTNATQSPTVSYSQVRTNHYKSGNSTTTTLTTGGSISYSETTASSYASVNSSSGVVTWSASNTGDRRTVGITATVSMNGKSGSKAATAGQKADYITSTSYGDVTKGAITNTTIPASGTTTNYTATAGNGSQVITYTWKSGKANTSETKTISPSVSSISATASSKGTNADGTITTVKSQSVTWTGYGNKSTSGTMYIYQAANYRSLYSVYLYPYKPDSWWIVDVVNGNWSTCPSAGGYVKLYGYANYSHTSGSYLNDQLVTLDAGVTWSTGKDSWITNHSNGGYYIHSRGTTTGDARSSNATWSYTYGGVTKTSAAKTLTQQANIDTVTYGSWETVNSSTWSGWSDYDYPYADTTGNYTVTCSIGDGMTAGGGSATVTASASHTLYKWKRQRRSNTQYRDVYHSFTSGESYTTDNGSSQTVYEYQQASNGNSTVADAVSLAIVSNGNSRFSLSGTTLSHSSMGTSVTTDTVTVRATNANSTSVTKDASKSIANAVTNSAYNAYNGNYWVECSIGNGISAGGGSATVSHSAGHTYYYQYLYTSGSVAPTSSTYYSYTQTDSSSIVEVSDNNGRYSISGKTLYHDHMTTNETTDTVKIRAINASNTSVTKDVTHSVTNSKTISGYGDWKAVSSWGSWSDYDRPYDNTYGNYTAYCSIGSGMTAAGGAATVTSSAQHTVYKWKRQIQSGTQYRDVYYSFTSGSTSTGTNHSSQTAYNYQKVSDGSYTANDTPTTTIYSNGNSRFSLSGTTLYHSNMEKNPVTDTVVVRVVNSAATSVYHDATASITNSVGSYYDNGSWSSWTDSGSPYYVGSEWEGSTSAYWVDCSIGSGITAAGGSATITASAGHTRNFYKSRDIATYRTMPIRRDFTSGSYDTSSRSESSSRSYDYVLQRTASASDVVAIKEQYDNNGRFSVNHTTLSHSSMGTSVTTDTCTVRVTNSGNTSVYKDASVSVNNALVSNNRTVTANTTSVSYASTIVTLTVTATDTYTSGTYDATTTLSSGLGLLSSTSVTGANKTVTLSIPANVSTSQRRITVSMDGTLKLNITQAGAPNEITVVMYDTTSESLNYDIYDEAYGEGVYDGSEFTLKNNVGLELLYYNGESDYTCCLAVTNSSGEVKSICVDPEDEGLLTLSVSEIKNNFSKDSRGRYVIYFYVSTY